MALIKWISGWLLFNLLVVILLTGVGGALDSEKDVGNYSMNISVDSGDSIGRSDVSFWDAFTWSIGNLPWWVDALLIMDTLLGAVMFALFIRGVN